MATATVTTTTTAAPAAATQISAPVAATAAVPAATAAGAVVPAIATAEAARSASREMLRNEIIIGAGITLLGGAIGFGYGLWKNQRAKRTGTGAVESDLMAAFEGALIGLIIALAAVLLYRSFFHGQALYHQARLQQQEALARIQQARLQHAAALSTVAPAVNVAGLQSAGRMGLGPAANPAVAARLASTA
jgi:hypothetical protein